MFVTLTDCQILVMVAQLGTFAAAAEQMHLTPSAISHAVSGMEAECGFPLFTRTKSGVTMTAAGESLFPSIRQMLASSEQMEQSIAQINGMHKGVLRLGVFNSACVTWIPHLVPPFQQEFPGIDVQIYQGSYADIVAWLKNGAVELGFLSNSSAKDLDFEPLYEDPLVCIAPDSYQPRRPGCVHAEELKGRPFVSQQADVDADIQSYFKKNDLHVNSRCYIVDDQSMIAMVACGQGVGHHAGTDAQKTAPPAAAARCCGWNRPPGAALGWPAFPKAGCPRRPAALWNTPAALPRP